MKWKTLLLSIVIFSLTCTPSYAVLGVGDIVFDPAAFSQQLISYMNMVRQYITQAQQYATQLQQLSAQTQNLQNLNYLIDLTGMQDMQRIIQSARGIASDYASMQRQYDEMYPEFSKFSTMTGEDFARKALQWTQETANTNRDAMELLSKTRDWFNSDSNDLRNLTFKANAVSGAKDGLQAIAQIAALQSKQLIQLQQTMSASAKSEGVYMAQKAEREAAALARMKKFAGNWEDDVEAWKESQEKPSKPYWNK